MTDHVFGDSRFGYMDAEHPQFAVDSRRTVAGMWAIGDGAKPKIFVRSDEN